MTDLTRPVTRRVNAMWRGREVPLIIEISPSGVITFREKGSRKSYSISVMTCYYMAVKQNKEK